MNTYRRSLPAFLFVLGFAAAPLHADDAATKIYLAGLKSCVLLVDSSMHARGSGSVINARDGCIITNFHVIRGAIALDKNGKPKKDKDGKPLPIQMRVIFPMYENGRIVIEWERYEAKFRTLCLEASVVAGDPTIDLAVIRLDDPKKMPPETAAVKFAAESPLPGASLISVGSPGASDAAWTFTPGSVRSVYQKKWEAGGDKGAQHTHHAARVIEATSPVSPGDSGGACYNDKGEQVGVAQGISMQVQNLSIFIDVLEVKAFLRKNKVEFDATGGPGGAEVAVAPDPQPVKAEPKKDVEPQPKVEANAKDPPKKDSADDEMAKLEKKAADQLNFVRKLVSDPSRKAFVVSQLEQIIKMYPNTKAAKEAKEILTKLK